MVRLLFFLFCASTVAGLNAQNDKQVVSQDVITPNMIANGTRVIYLVRFESLGLTPLQEVIIRDTLDPRLDASTLQIDGQSHPCDLVLGSDNTARFFFSNFNMPGQQLTQTQSTGWILFSLRPRPFLQPGQVIPNTAYIEMDGLAPIPTTPALLWIEADSKAPEPAFTSTLKVVPNPNHGVFQLRSTNNSSTSQPTWYWITDTSGRRVWQHQLDSALADNFEVRLDVTKPGMYLFWHQDGNRMHVEPFVLAE